MQMITYFRSIFPTESCWLNTYHIQATGPDTGLLETITSSQDIDGLKKHQPGLSLIQMFEGRYGARDGAKFKEARDNFAKSLGAYSIVMWLLLLRDRRTSNRCYEAATIDIDFGSSRPLAGGGIGGMVELSPEAHRRAPRCSAAPVRPAGSCTARRASRRCRRCTSTAKRSARSSRSPARARTSCFEHMPVERIIQLRERLFLHRRRRSSETRRVIEVAREHKGTRYYDYFQNKQQGYAI